MGEKEELLAAIAAAGTQGRLDYENAKAANAAAQQQAVQAALLGAYNSNPGFQSELAGMIGRPYEAANTYLDANARAQETWMNEAKWNTGVFQGNIERLRDALVAQTLAEAAARGSGSGGGGGGGGGGSTDSWYDALRDQFGTQKLGFDAIRAEAKRLGLDSSNPELAGMPRYLQTRAFATNEYGVPEDVAANQFGPSEFGTAIMEDAGVAPMDSLRDFKAFVKNARKGEKSTPGSQRYWVREAKKKAEKRLPAKAQKKLQKRRNRRR